MGDGSLSAHLAADRVVACADGTEVSGPCIGAALFADLAGFTRLTEALAVRLGPRRGAEELSRHLDGVYDVIIAEVHRYGGAVVVFSGDAVTCWFDDDRPARSARGVHRATTCALRLQRALDALGAVVLPDGSSIELSIKVAIAAGPAFRVLVGDPAIRLVDVLAGQTLERTAAAERVAQPGEVVVDGRAAGELADVVDLSEWRSDANARPVAVVRDLRQRCAPAPWWTDGPPEITLEQARPWVVEAMRDRPEARVIELRTTVALFVRFGDFNFDQDPSAPEELDSYVRRVEAIAVRHGGTLINVTLGDKGSYLYVAFGAPVAHEDQADRAVACALDLRDLPADAGAAGPVSIGLDLGVTRTGAYGAAQRHTFGVLGDATNVAARLMSLAAPGEILASDRVRRDCRRRVTLEETPAVAVRGHDEPVAVVRIIGRPVGGVRHRAFGTLVGRAAELGALRPAVDAVRDGPAGAVVVDGDPGVGKSHLIEALRADVDNGDDLSWYEVTAHDGPRTPLHAFLPLIRDLFYQDLAQDPATAMSLFELGIAELAAAIADRGEEVEQLRMELLADTSYLGALLDLHWEDSPYERHDPTTQFARSLAAIDTVLRAESARRPLVVHVRDGHWLDEGSRRVVRSLCVSATDRPICVLIDRRSSDDEWLPAVPEPGAPALHIRLDPLSGEGVAALVATLLGGPPDQGLVDQLWSRTAGNALFVEQLAFDLRDRTALVQDVNGVWSFAPGEGTALPATLAAVLVSRLDRLDEQLRRTVSAGAVLGERFDLSVLAYMVDDAVDRLRPTVAAGVAAGVWHQLDGDELVFRHALLRDAAYEMQLDADLQVLHRRAARAIAAVSDRTGRSVARSVELAHHEERCGQRLRAAAHLRRAATDAARDHAYHEASNRLRGALRLLVSVDGSPCTTARLLATLGDTAAASGDYETAVESYEAALELDDRLTPNRVTSLRLRLGEAELRWGHDAAAEAAFEAGLATLQESPDLVTASEIYVGLAMVHGRREQLDDAVELAEMALTFSGSDETCAARAHQCLGTLELQRARHDAARAHAAKSRDLWEVLGNPQGIAATTNNLGMVHESVGDFAAAISEFRAAVDQFEAVGNEHGLACALDNLAQALARNGEERAAMEHLERAVEILFRIGMADEAVVPAMWRAGSW